MIKDLIKSDRVRRANPRTTADLLEEITGAEAIWFRPDANQLPLYNVIVENLYYPIKFINNAWHFLK
jgi:hypothetical protein